MYIHIARLYLEVLPGYFFGVLIASRCASAKRGDRHLKGETDDTMNLLSR